jgi:hypothetical protein
MNLYSYIAHFYPISVKFGITYPRAMLLSICKFSDNQRREGRIFLMGTNEITFTRLP